MQSQSPLLQSSRNLNLVLLNRTLNLMTLYGIFNPITIHTDSRFMVHKVMVHKVHGSPWWFVYTIAPIISRTTTPGTSRLTWCSLLHRITPRVLTSIFSVPLLLPIHPSVYLLLKISTG